MNRRTFVGKVVSASALIASGRLLPASNIQWATTVSAFEFPAATFRPLPVQHSVPLRGGNYVGWMNARAAGGYVVDAGGAVTPSGRDQVGDEDFISSSYMQIKERFNAITKVLDTFEADGQELWIYDEYAYPSGAAGGLSFADGHDHLAAQVASCRWFEAGDVIQARTDGSVLLCVELSKSGTSLDLKGARQFALPENGDPVTYKSSRNDRVVCLIEQHLSDVWKRHNMKRRLLNVISKEAVARFMDVTHEVYAKHLGDDIKRIGAFFTDEPQFGSSEVWGKGGLAENDPMVQWTDELVTEFRARKGYDLLPILPALFADVGSVTARLRYDFYDVQSDLMAENYFGQIGDWCHEHGTLSTGHLLLEESLLFHAMFSGSAFKCWMKQDLPGMDLLGAMPYRSMAFHWEPASMPVNEDLSCKMVSSVAHLLDRPGVFTESFATATKSTLRDVLGTTAWQFSQGITHMTTYTIQNTFSAKEYASFSKFAGRLAMHGRRGKPVSRVAVLVPMASVWSVYNPPSGGGFARYFSDNPQATRIDAVFRHCCEVLLANQQQFEILPEEILRKSEVRDGKLICGSMEFSALVVPQLQYAADGVLPVLRSFIESGGAVQFVGDLPPEEAPGDSRSSLREEITYWLSRRHRNRVHLPEIDLNWITERVAWDFRWVGDSQARLQVKQDGDSWVLVLANPSEQAITGGIESRVRGLRDGQLLNPETGNSESLKHPPRVLELPAKTARILTFES
ncbi:glycosyl hydrolase [Coraliomargarita sp. W4R53]